MTQEANIRFERVANMDELMTRIGETIQQHHHHTPDTGLDDAAPEGLEAQLRQLLPGHALWRVNTRLRSSDDDRPVRVAEVVWSTPATLWWVCLYACPGTGDSGYLYHLQVEGEDTKISRDHLTIDQAFGLLYHLGILPMMP